MTEHERWQWQEPGMAWKEAGLYHITLTVPSREPLLGTLVILDNDAAKAWVNYSDLGKAVLECLRQVSVHHPEIQVLHYCLMPDHLHSVWYVRYRMPKGIMTAVRGFWQGVKKAGRNYFSSVTPDSIRQNHQEKSNTDKNSRDKEDQYKYTERIFTEMPFVRPMGQRRQLPATIRYIDMNPQRLATKRLMPQYFRVQEGIQIAGRTYAAVGNADLLQRAKYMPVHVRRTMVEEEEHGDNRRLRDYMNNCVLAARQGAVMVSPFISPKEKEVMEVLLKEGLPFIYIADNGFRDYYKPQDSLFDAVARKQVLILSPWEYDADKHHVTRADCIAMNQMAEEICAPEQTV